MVFRVVFPDRPRSARAREAPSSPREIRETETIMKTRCRAEVNLARRVNFGSRPESLTLCSFLRGRVHLAIVADS